jgi:hypothetical protein
MPGRRQRAQGLVEYGLIALTVAIVGATGLNILTTAQKNYFTDLPMNPPAPSAPGALLHPTSVDAPQCSPSPNVALGSPIVCAAPTVHDIFSNASDRKPPWGTITLHLDADPTPLATCILPHATSGSQNVCASTLTWTPTDAALAGTTHTLSLKYGFGAGYVPGYPPLPDPESNHVSSASTSFSITFLRYQFNGVPQCGSGSNQVEVGSPISCSAAVYDLTTMGPAVNVPVTWAAIDDPGNGTGTALLSCSTGGITANFASMIWNNPPTPSCQPAGTLTCTTNSAGVCSVIFRRVRTLMGAAPLTAGYQDLTVSVVNGGSLTSGTAAWPSHAISITNAASPHKTLASLRCTSSGSSPNVTVQPPGTTVFNAHAALVWTSDVTIVGNTGSVSCNPTVIDIDPAPALDCYAASPWCDIGAANPDQHDSHAPVGTVIMYWRLPGDVAGPTIKSCTLQRFDASPVVPNPTPPNPPNQTPIWFTPYASTCGSPVTIPLTSLNGTNNELDDLIVLIQPGSSSTHTDGGTSLSTHIAFTP